MTVKSMAINLFAGRPPGPKGCQSSLGVHHYMAFIHSDSDVLGQTFGDYKIPFLSTKSIVDQYSEHGEAAIGNNTGLQTYVGTETSQYKAISQVFHFSMYCYHIEQNNDGSELNGIRGCVKQYVLLVQASDFYRVNVLLYENISLPSGGIVAKPIDGSSPWIGRWNRYFTFSDQLQCDCNSWIEPAQPGEASTPEDPDNPQEPAFAPIMYGPGDYEPACRLLVQVGIN